MKTTTLHLYGRRGLRLETFDLSEVQEDEVLATVVIDNLCLSSWKETNPGENHRKVPDDVATNPTIIDHEFCDGILAVGKRWQHKFQPGQRYTIQVNLQLPDRPDYPGHSFPWTGDEATHVVIPSEVMEQDRPLAYDGETHFEDSLVEPLPYVIGAFNANYHLQESSCSHTVGVRPQGRTLILGGTGPMGLLTIDCVLYGPANPSLLVATDTNNDKLSYTYKHHPSEPQTLTHYLNVAGATFDTLMALSGDHGFDDIFVSVLNEGLVILASSLLAADGCLDFFARPQDKHLSTPTNFYDVHYTFTHYVGTSNDNISNMRAAVKLIEEKKVQAVEVITHILGLNTTGETTLELPAVDGGGKLVYTRKFLPLTSFTQIQDQVLVAILARHQGIWPGGAEQYLLTHAEAVSHDQSRYLTLYVTDWLPRQLRDLMCG